MTTLNLKQDQLLNKSEKLLLTVFTPLKIESNTEMSFSEKLKNIRFDNFSKILQDKILKIEEIKGKKAAINYLNGYLEYHNITMKDIINKTNNN